MALDLYAGPLSRYLADAWEGDAADDPAALAEARQTVDAWRRGVARALADDLAGQALDWSEAVDHPYFAVRPDWTVTTRRAGSLRGPRRPQDWLGARAGPAEPTPRAA